MSNKTNISIHCTLTDAELAAKADQWVDDLIASGGKSFTMQAPARPNADTDLIFAELNNRFKELLHRAGRYEKALKQIEQMSDPGNYWKAICDTKAIATEALNCKSNDNGTTDK